MGVRSGSLEHANRQTKMGNCFGNVIHRSEDKNSVSLMNVYFPEFWHLLQPTNVKRTHCVV